VCVCVCARVCARVHVCVCVRVCVPNVTKYRWALVSCAGASSACSSTTHTAASPLSGAHWSCRSGPLPGPPDCTARCNHCSTASANIAMHQPKPMWRIGGALKLSYTHASGARWSSVPEAARSHAHTKVLVHTENSCSCSDLREACWPAAEAILALFYVLARFNFPAAQTAEAAPMWPVSSSVCIAPGPACLFSL